MLRSHVVRMFAVFSAVAAMTSAASAQKKPPEGLQVDPETRTIVVPCKVAPRKLPKLNEIYPIEVVATYPAPRGQKAHETVVTFDVKPSEIHEALESLGLKPGKPAKGEGARASGPEVKIFLEVPGPANTTRRLPIERTLVDRRTGKTMPKLKWLFTGSIRKQPDPQKAETVYAADATGTLIAIFPVTDETVFQTNLTMKDEPLLKLETNTKVLPEIGTDVKLIVQAPKPKK